MAVKAFSQTLIGSREMNQDALLVAEDKGLFAVADGVGGGLKGEVASNMAVEALKLYAPPAGPLTPTIERIQEDILAEALHSLGEPLMGTTLTAVRLRGSEATLAHVGDSHCYHYTQSVLRLLTEDHEAYDETFGGPVLMSYLGLSSESHALKIQEEVFAVAPGDRILLCSDGLYKQISEMRISKIIQENWDSPEVAVSTMCAEASVAERSDNITVVYVVID